MLGNLIVFNLSQPENTLFPNSVTESGIEIFVKLSRFEKALFPINITESGIVTLII